MCTLILSFIQAKYKSEFELLFIVTILFDLIILTMICEVLGI